LAGAEPQEWGRDQMQDGTFIGLDVHKATISIAVARVDSGVAVVPLAATLVCRRGLSAHLAIEPDCQRAPAFKRFIVGWSVPSMVGWRYVSAHACQLPCWFHEMNPSQDVSNRANGVYKTELVNRQGRDATCKIWKFPRSDG